MKNRPALMMAAGLIGLGVFAHAQEKAPALSGVEGVKGVKQDAVEKVKNVESGVTTGAKSETQGVNKVGGVETISEVKADGRAMVVPVPPPPQSVQPIPPVQSVKPVPPVQAVEPVPPVQAVKPVPPPQAVQPIPPVQAVKPVPPVQAVTPVISGAGSIQAVNGVSGINAAKLQNLEAALLIKHAEAPETGGKGRAAAAGLLGAPLGKPGPKTKEDGRAGFQEFEKLQNAGS